VVKLVVASAGDSDGDQIYPHKWNHDFIGLPIVKKEGQRRPTVTETELGEVLNSQIACVDETLAVFDWH
jgi:hypothetical protein